MIDFRKIWDRIAYALVEAVFPTKCLVCGEFFFAASERGYALEGSSGYHLPETYGTFPVPQMPAGVLACRIPDMLQMRRHVQIP